MSSGATFVAECLWPNVTQTDVDALDRRLTAHLSSSVDHVGTTLVPEDDVVFVWFAAATAREVEQACLTSSVPFDRIVAVTGWAPSEPPLPNERIAS